MAQAPGTDNEIDHQMEQAPHTQHNMQLRPRQKSSGQIAREEIMKQLEHHISSYNNNYNSAPQQLQYKLKCDEHKQHDWEPVCISSVKQGNTQRRIGDTGGKGRDARYYVVVDYKNDKNGNWDENAFVFFANYSDCFNLFEILPKVIETEEEKQTLNRFEQECHNFGDWKMVCLFQFLF